MNTGILSGIDVISNWGTAAEDVQLIYADELQCSSLFDLNMAYTAETVNHNLFWTWHLNFNLPILDDASNVVGFYACTHFFWRAAHGLAFYPAADYIVTPCSIIDDGGGIPNTVPESTLVTSIHAGTRVGTRVEFRGWHRVECGFDLGEIGALYAQTAELENGINEYVTNVATGSTYDAVLGVVRDELERLTTDSPQTYPSFSLGGVAENLEPSGESVQAPMLYYQPMPASGASYPNFWLEPSLYESSATRMGGGIGEDRFDAIVRGECLSNDGECLLDQGESRWFYFMEYGVPAVSSHPASGCSEPSSANTAFLLFHARKMGVVSSAWWRWCPEDIEPDIYSTPSMPGLNEIPLFWTGETVIHVGFNPIDHTYLNANLFEVWLDPDGSGTNPD